MDRPLGTRPSTGVVSAVLQSVSQSHFCADGGALRERVSRPLRRAGRSGLWNIRDLDRHRQEWWPTSSGCRRCRASGAASLRPDHGRASERRRVSDALCRRIDRWTVERRRHGALRTRPDRSNVARVQPRPEAGRTPLSLVARSELAATASPPRHRVGRKRGAADRRTPPLTSS